MIETIIDVNNFNPILVLFKHRIHSTFRAVSINFNPILVLFKLGNVITVFAPFVDFNPILVLFKLKISL